MLRLTYDLAVAEEFAQLTSEFSTIEGFLDPLEGFLLYRLAASGPGLGAIVEIGSFCGRSTAYLAAGSLASARARVVAVDHFRGSPEHQPGKRFASPFLARDGSTFPRFRDNLHRVGLLDHVQPVQKASVDAAASWSGPIRLLFIDGSHDYPIVCGDFNRWVPFVVQGGLIGLHDVGNSPDVTRLFEEASVNSREYRLVCGTRSLRVLQKCSMVSRPE